MQHVEGGSAGRIERHDLAVQDHPAHRLLAKLFGQARKRGRQLEPAPRAQLHLLAVDEREHPVAVELGLPRPVGMVERSLADLGVHRLELRGHGFDLPRGNEPGRGHAVRGHHLHLLDCHAGKHRAVLRGDLLVRHEPVLVLDQQPALDVLRAHQRKRPLHLLAAQQEAELPFFEPFPHSPLGLLAVVEPVLLAFVRRI